MRNMWDFGPATGPRPVVLELSGRTSISKNNNNTLEFKRFLFG